MKSLMACNAATKEEINKAAALSMHATPLMIRRILHQHI